LTTVGAGVHFPSFTLTSVIFFTVHISIGSDVSTQLILLHRLFCSMQNPIWGLKELRMGKCRENHVGVNDDIKLDKLSCEHHVVAINVTTNQASSNDDLDSRLLALGISHVYTLLLSTLSLELHELGNLTNSLL